MEVVSELLWKACSWFLLSFLVERLISLLVWLSDDDSVCGSIKENGFERSAIGVKFYDQSTGIVQGVNFRDIDLSVCSTEINLVDLSEREKSALRVGYFQDLIDDFNGESEGKDGIKNNEEEESGEFSKDLIEKEEEVEGFDDEFSSRKLESGTSKAIDHIKEAIEGLKDSACHEIGAVLEGEKSWDDERKGENSSNVHKGEISGREFSKDEGVLSDDEEWEGVERSELEKRFARAMNLVGCKDKEGQLVKVGNEVMMQLYALQKVAMEGPCHEPQPMALKLSARAKWNAWQKLGNTSREDAMEQYIKLLSENSLEGVEDAHSSVKSESSSSEAAIDSYPDAT